ncbi:hypothetical protein ACHAWO_004459 [Cyclotella atomus]|uniref:B9 domain-containing protein 1 n=1 Tax=Cyclotella atomus TaxID=382360 RepID=A0ABD3P048_9STRA
MTADSTVLRSPSGRYLRPPSANNDTNIQLPSNQQPHLKNYRPNSLNSVVTMPTFTPSSESTSSFFVMVTGTIESVTSLASNELYCRYTFAYGPDWEVVHGVSMGLSQIGRCGIVKSRDASEDGSNTIVWNFPIEISFQSTNPFGWPRLALSIYGFDFLGRDVLVGYASLLVPINPGRHTKHLKTFKPVSGGRCQQILNWIMGTNPEYYDSKMVTRSEGRGVTKMISDDGSVVKVNLTVTRKDFNSFGYSSQSTQS